MPKGEKRPAVERVDNVLNVTTATLEIVKAQNKLRTSDDRRRLILDALGEKATDEIINALDEEIGTGPAYTELRENVKKVCVAIRVAVRAVEECSNANAARKLADFMIREGFFKPAPEVKEADKK